jgi:eukaryotic-like serine/threonine-protein kinase
MNAGRLSSGQLIRDTYTIVRHLGSGAFGDVYLARHRYMGLQAMKIFSKRESPDALEEAYLLTKLNHPNIVRMFEANEFQVEEESYGYFTMEYVEGGTLANYKNATSAFASKLYLAAGLLSGLAYAHSQNPPIIHRDISPSNILVDVLQSGSVAKISDFGLAKHLDTASLLASAAGKYLYMAPESFLGIHTTATDVYAGGIVLFELLTGEHPFKVALSHTAKDEEVAAAVRRSRTQTIPDVCHLNAELDARWRSFFKAALAHNYDDRPRDAGKLLELFNCLVSNAGISSVSTSVPAMVLRAKELSSQVSTLDGAIELLETACTRDPMVRAEYAELLSFWKRGIVQ